jgi:predicted DNA-binding transcriptional regulator AlpA
MSKITSKTFPPRGTDPQPAPQADDLTAIPQADRYINSRQLRQILPVSSMTVWRLEQQGKLPKHMRLGGRSFWRLHAVLKALGNLAQERE